MGNNDGTEDRLREMFVNGPLAPENLSAQIDELYGLHDTFAGIDMGTTPPPWKRDQKQEIVIEQCGCVEVSLGAKDIDLGPFAVQATMFHRLKGCQQHPLPKNLDG